MKKLVTFLLVLSLYIPFAWAEGVLVSEPAAISTTAIGPDSNVVQDISSFMGNTLSFKSIEIERDYQCRSFSGGADTYALLSQYVQRLCAQDNNFRLVDSYYSSYGALTSYSYALDYTGAARITGEKQEMAYKDNVYGDVCIYGQTDRSSSHGTIFISTGLTFDDLGMRLSGQDEDISLPGQSLGAALYRLNDGSYQTDDGRFHVEVGEAAVYRDGVLCTTAATLTRNQAKNREELRINDFYCNDSILLTVPYNSVLTGDILDRSSIALNESISFDNTDGNTEDFLSKSFSNKILGVSHNGDGLLFYRDKQNAFSEGVVRVMYWDPAQDTAVFYIYASFGSAPYEYEAIAAVAMGTTPQSANADTVLSMRAGTEITIHYDGSVFGTGYNLYTWEILEGSSLIELSNTRSSTCTVKAYEAGTVQLKITYKYSTKGRNVLTGLPETQFKSKSRVYAIQITP